MSFEQDSVIFKQKLYENFKQTGLLNRLQTTLRANLLEKIQKPNRDLSSEVQRQKFEKIQAAKPFHLKKKFVQNIIHDYLLRQKMQYSLSIFMPQSGLQQKDVLKFNVLAEIANLPHYETQDQEESFLQCLIDEWVKKNSNPRRDRGIQTDSQGEPVSKKLQNIQRQYFAKIDYWKLIPNKQVSDNPTLYQHQQKMKAQFQVQKEKVRLDTQRIIRAQMQRKFQSQYEFRLNQVTKQHQKRITQLKMRQKQIMQSLERKKNELQQKAKDLSTKQLQLIQKYETREKEIQAYYKNRQMEIEKREKDFWKKELELKAKKRQYEDAIRLVKQKAIGEAGEMPKQFSNQTHFDGKSSFYS